MKKSFLKRAMAAAVAVPVALTQTAMFASFAAGEGASEGGMTVINTATLTNVECDTEVNPPVVDSTYGAEEATYENAIVQESIWNEKLQAALNSMLGTEISVNGAKLADSIKSENTYANLLKAVLRDENTKATAIVNSDDVTITINADYDYGKEVTERAKKMIAEQYPDIEMDLNVTGKVKGTIVITVDTTELTESKSVIATVEYDIDGFDNEKLAHVAAIEYARAQFDSVEKQLDAQVDKTVAKYQKQLDEANDEWDAAFEKVTNARADWADAKQQVEDAEDDLADAETEVAQAEEELEDAKAKYGDASAEFAEKKSKLENAKADLADAEDKLADANKKLDEADEKLTDAEQQLADARVKLDNAQAELDEADAGAKQKIADLIDNYRNLLDKAEAKTEAAYNKSGAREAEFADVDEMVTKGRDFAVRKVGRLDRLPETIADAQDTKYYDAASDLFASVVEQINKSANPKGYDVQVTLDDAVEAAQSVENITAGLAGGEGTYVGYATAYFKEDTDYDQEIYVTYFNKQLADQGLEVVPESIQHVKAVDVIAGAQESQLMAAANVNVYRVVWYTETKPIETEPTTEETTEETTEPTEETTEPTEETTEPTEETTEPTEEPIGRSDVKVTVKGGFYFSHDPRAFETLNLIESATITTKDANGNETTRPLSQKEINENFSFSFHRANLFTEAEPEGTKVSPQSAYADKELNSLGAYVDNSLYVYYQGDLVANAYAPICIGVKGDANLDGVANASDAAQVLIFAANYGGGKNPSINSETNEKIENFAYFLADTNGESEDHGKTASYDASVESPLNSSDAAQILIYAAIKGGSSEGKCDWIPQVIKSEPYPTYSEEIAKYAGLI